jgi:hypothetical protein
VQYGRCLFWVVAPFHGQHVAVPGDDDGLPMQLRVLKIDSPELTQFAAQLAVGKIYASGHGFVPQVRTAIYDRLSQFADPAPAPGLPATWDDIDVATSTAPSTTQ